MDIFKKAELLKIEGYGVLKNLQLLEKLTKLGTANLIGSMALGLMVYRDIDIEVIVEKLDRSLIIKVVNDLILEKSRRIDFSVIDNVNKSKEKFPEGIYLGIKCHLGMDWLPDFSKNESTWKIDIWFVEVENARGWEATKEINSKLNDGKRKIILEIKNLLYKNPGYRKAFSAMDIYKAVLYHNVVNIEGFKIYQKSV